jgi:hypothetical protein
MHNVFELSAWSAICASTAQRISNEIGESQCCRFTDANL